MNGPPAGDAAARRRHALVSPFRNGTNRYTALQQRALSELGYEVLPLSLGFLVRGGWRHLLSRSNVLILHWLELRAFAHRRGRIRIRPMGLLEVVVYALIVVLSRARSVYFVHDHAVHDAQGWRGRLSAVLIDSIGRLCTARVVHAPQFTERYKATYLPHPLYWDADRDGGRPSGTPPAGRPDRTTSVPRFAVLGALRPYKGITEMLEHWPKGAALTIAGAGSPDYVARLEASVSRRGLCGDVRIESRFLDDDEFDARLGEADVLVLPHLPGTMLVSGAFFEAIGRVPVLVARATPFTRWASTRFAGVRCFDTDADVARVIEAIVVTRGMAHAGQDRQAAIEAFGWDTCLATYGAFLQRLLEGRR